LDRASSPLSTLPQKQKRGTGVKTRKWTLSKPKRKLKGLQNETISFRDPKRDASKKSDFVSVMSKRVPRFYN